MQRAQPSPAKQSPVQQSRAQSQSPAQPSVHDQSDTGNTEAYVLRVEAADPLEQQQQSSKAEPSPAQHTISDESFRPAICL
jgi:hypothetical protein